MAKAAFYELFGGREPAIRYACEFGRRTLVDPIEAAASVPGTWEERLSRTLGALLDTAGEEARLAELCLVHSPALLPEWVGPYDAVLVSTLSRAWSELPPEATGSNGERPLSFAEMGAYAVVSIVAQRLIDDEAASLGELRDEFTTLVSFAYR